MFKSIPKKRLTILLVSLFSVVALTVGITLAYVFTQTEDVENTFAPSKVACAVVENGEGTEHFNGTVDVSGKYDVKIKNTGDTDAYIRVAVVITWKNEAGNVWAMAPTEGEGNDYTISYNLSNGWVKGADGYYYYTSAVKPGNATNVLISSVNQLKDGPKGTDGTQYYLSVEVVASAIQSTPTSVVSEQWNVPVNGGSLAPVTDTEGAT